MSGRGPLEVVENTGEGEALELSRAEHSVPEEASLPEESSLADELSTLGLDVGALIDAQAEKAEEPSSEPTLEEMPQAVEARLEDPELEELEAAPIEQQVDEEASAEGAGVGAAELTFDKIESRARKLSPEQARSIVESILFVADKPLGLEALRACTGLEAAAVKEACASLAEEGRAGRGVVLNEVAGGWQFRTSPANAEYVRRFLKVKPQRLTRAALETLAIVAYRQPVTRPEIEDVRAVDCGAVLKALLERQLVKIIGKKEEVGRPLLYGTTREFLEFFNLRDLASLPTLREFQELSEESRTIVEKETGEAPVPTTARMVAELRDDTFEQKLAESSAEADAALEDLETAMADSEAKSRQTTKVLDDAVRPASGEGNSEGEEE